MSKKILFSLTNFI